MIASDIPRFSLQYLPSFLVADETTSLIAFETFGTAGLDFGDESGKPVAGCEIRQK